MLMSLKLILTKYFSKSYQVNAAVTLRVDLIVEVASGLRIFAILKCSPDSLSVSNF